MANRKSTKKYYFSVEGETEQWYLQWLQNQINNTEEAEYTVSFDCRVQKNPLKRAKSLVIVTDHMHIEDSILLHLIVLITKSLRIWVNISMRTISNVFYQG